MPSYRCNKCGKTIEGDSSLLKKFETELCDKGGPHDFRIHAKMQLKLHDIVKVGATRIGFIVFGAIFLKNLIALFFREYPVQSIIVLIVAVVLIVIFIRSKRRK
jgi:hypothetical protein